jgi:hypothetical protein
MKPMGTDFNAKDICSIIKACKDSGVKHLSLGELSIKFDASERGLPVDISPHSVANSNVEPPKQIITPMDREQERILEETRLMIEDPMGYEQRIMDGDIDIEVARERYETSQDRRPEDDLPGRGSGGQGIIQ